VECGMRIADCVEDSSYKSAIRNLKYIALCQQ
jgi:hypothetical protein